MSRGIQTYMKPTQRTPKLRTTICGSHKVLSLVGFEPTTPLWEPLKPSGHKVYPKCLPYT